ncbi:hypothetical protein F5Y08DRAFT_154378 [Xylaria arbuscula]|nr:hypothetical protein F5Y08DRAFT_154378 [Xylaria arbuscula]
MSGNPITSNLASNWLPNFAPQGFILLGVRFEVDCGICQKSLAISSPARNNESERFNILPCGHAYCVRCTTRWMETSELPTCPSCRGPLVHSVCGHRVSLRPLEGGMTRLRQAISDSIKEIAPLCPDCENRGGANGGGGPPRPGHSRPNLPEPPRGPGGRRGAIALENAPDPRQRHSQRAPRPREPRSPLIPREEVNAQHQDAETDALIARMAARIAHRPGM